MADTKEKAIEVPKEEQIDNSIAVSALQVEGGDTGIDSDDRRAQPKTLKIYQSGDTQDKYFAEDSQPTKADYGKLFLYEKDITLRREDLHSSIEGTLLRYNNGFTIFKPKPGNPKQMDKDGWVGSGKGTIGQIGVPISKEDFVVKFPNWNFENRVRMILVQGGAQEAVNNYMYGGNPFFEIILKRASYGVSFGIHTKMKSAISKDETLKKFLIENKIVKPPAHVYKFVITSEKTKDTNTGKEYFIPKIDIKTNTVDDIVELRSLFELFLHFPMFGNMADVLEKANSTEEAETLSDKTTVPGETTDDELPF